MRRRLAALAAVLALGGCGETAVTKAGGEVGGDTLSVYALLPDGGPNAAASRDIVDGQKLALAEAKGKAGPYKVNFAALNHEGADVADIARQAIRDPATIAIVGDLSFATARVDVPLINEAGILHVSPAVTYGGFLDDPAGRWSPSGRRTFVPMLPPDGAHADALARAARGRVALEVESGESSRAFAAQLREKLGPLVATERADSVVYVGADPASAAGVVEGIARENRRARILLPEALYLAGTADRLPARVARRVAFVTATGPETPAAFERTFARPAGPYAQLGYDAMRSVLDAIGTAGERASRRQVLIDTYFESDPLARALARPFWTVTLRDGRPSYSAVAG